MPLISSLAPPGSLCRIRALSLYLTRRGASRRLPFRILGLVAPSSYPPSCVPFGHRAGHLLFSHWGRLPAAHHETRPGRSGGCCPRPSASHSIYEALQRIEPRLYTVPLKNQRLPVPGHEKPLLSVLTGYINCMTFASDRPAYPLNHRESHCLSSCGYGVEDLELWTSGLLLGDFASIAALYNSKGTHTTPSFLLILLLQRSELHYLTLQVLLRHIRDKIQDESVPLAHLNSMLTLFVRHACREWPDCLPFVADLITVWIQKRLTRIHNPRFRTSVTTLCNQCLVWFSKPATINPVISSIYQAQAQFHILRFMASQYPALIVTRDGFRALARMQAAHRKTEQEREWAQLKTASWPPWKANKTAMDESKGTELGSSRADHVLSRMHEAGYASRTWEDVLRIYAGWDTDHSPTIQQRTALLDVPFLQGRHSIAHSFKWAARIRTTRTRREAWACFLSYEAYNRPNAKVYLAIFEKIFGKEVDLDTTNKTVCAPSSSRAALLPGDTAEVWPEPPSPNELTHISEPLPTYVQLWNRCNIALDRDLLIFILRTAPTFSLISEILRSPRAEHLGVHYLLDAPGIAHADHPTIPPRILTEFIGCLCRFSTSQYAPELIEFDPAMCTAHQRLIESSTKYRLDYAYTLLMQYRPHYRPAWTLLMKRMSRLGPDQEAVEVCRVLERLFGEMKKIGLPGDGEQLQILCRVVENGWRWSVGPGEGSKKGRWMTRRRNFWSRNLRLFFHALTCPDPSLGPSLGHVPDAVVLHAYTRALGWLEDYEGLYSLSSWMVAHQDKITAQAAARHAGQVRIRRTLCALRRYLEPSHRPESEWAPRDVVELVRGQMEGVAAWGGWPSDNEVADYVRHGQLSGERHRVFLGTAASPDV